MARRIDILSIVLTGLASLAWGGLVALGYEGLQGIVAQHVPGYPVSGQVFYYCGIPTIALAVSILTSIWCFWRPRIAWAGRLALFAALLALLPYLFFYGGGV